MEREDFEDGKVLRALQLTGTFKSVLDGIRSNPGEQKKDGGYLSTSDLDDAQLRQIVRHESEVFFQQGQTFLAAANFLAVNDMKSAIQTLVRANEIYIAYVLSINFLP